MNRFSIVLILILSGCVFSPHEGTNHAKDAGYDETTLGRETIASAINLVNKTLDPSLHLRFHPSWRQGIGIPVYSIAAASLSNHEHCFVPRGDKCVFINGGSVRGIQDLFFKPVGDSPSGVLPEEFWALILLHEAGHLYAGDQNAGDVHIDDSTVEYTLEMTDAKNIEQKADSFAAEQIRSAFHDLAAVERFATGARLFLVPGLISFNQTGDRLINKFGSTSFADRDVFWDAGNTHQNLELRVLYINYWLNPNSVSLQLISDFETKRRDGAAPTPSLFDSPFSFGTQPQ